MKLSCREWRVNFSFWYYNMSTLSFIIVESVVNLFLRELILNWAIINLLQFTWRISLSTLEGSSDLISVRLPTKFLLSLLLSYSENNIDSSLPFSFKFSLWLEWSVFLTKLGKFASYWSKPPLLSRSHQLNLYIKFLKFLANSMVPYLFKWSLLSFKCFAGSMVLVWLMTFMFRCWHIFVKRLLTSFTLLFKLSFLGTINETWTEFVSFFREFANSVIEFAIWLAVFSDLMSLVPTWCWYQQAVPKILSKFSGFELYVFEKNDEIIQKQPPEVFFEKRCSWKFRKIHKKTLVLESLQLY